MEHYRYNLELNTISHRGKDVSIETFLQESKPEDLLFIDAKISVTGKELEFFYSQIKNSNIKKILTVKTEKSYIDDEKEMSHLQEINQFCLDKNIKFDIELQNESAEYPKFAIAKQKIDDFIAKLKAFEQKRKDEGRELSVIEKYFIVYKFVANRVYNEDKENFLNNDMRNWMGVLSTDYVICSGFASLLKCVCDRAFSPDELKCCEQSCEVYDGQNNLLGAHALNALRIRDKKYDYDGILNSDSCWGANKENGEGNYSYCLNPLPVYGLITDRKFKFRDFWLYKDIENVEFIKDIDFAFYREHELLADLLKEKGLKPISQLRNETNIEEQLKIKEEAIKLENAKKEKAAQLKTQTFLEKYNFGEFAQIQLPVFYPKSVKEKYPILQEFQDLMQSKQEPPEEQFANVLKQVLDLYKSNTDLFNYLINELKESELNGMFDSVFGFCQFRFKENLENFNEHSEKKKIEKEIENSYSRQFKKLTKTAKNIIHSKPIPQKAIKEGLRAVAEFCGMSEEKVEKYINKEIEKIKTFKTKLNLPEEESEYINV